MQISIQNNVNIFHSLNFIPVVNRKTFDTEKNQIILTKIIRLLDRF